MPSQLFGVTDLNPSRQHFVSIRMQTWQPAHEPITARCDGKVACAHAQCAQIKPRTPFITAPCPAAETCGDFAVCEWGDFLLHFYSCVLGGGFWTLVSRTWRVMIMSARSSDNVIPRLPCAAYMIW